MRQKLAGSRLSKSRYSTNFEAHFVRRKKSLAKNFWHQKERSFDLLSFEGKHIDFEVNKPKLRRFEIRAFCDKMRPFLMLVKMTKTNGWLLAFFAGLLLQDSWNFLNWVGKVITIYIVFSILLQVIAFIQQYSAFKIIWKQRLVVVLYTCINMPLHQLNPKHLKLEIFFENCPLYKNS